MSLIDYNGTKKYSDMKLNSIEYRQSLYRYWYCQKYNLYNLNHLTQNCRRIRTEGSVSLEYPQLWFISVGNTEQLPLDQLRIGHWEQEAAAEGLTTTGV